MKKQIQITLSDQEKIAINKEIAQRLNFLRVLAREGVEEMDIAFRFFKHLIPDDPKDLSLDKISFVSSWVCKQYHHAIPGYKPTLFRCSLIWEYVYIFSYYFYSENEIWVKHILPQIKEAEASPFVKAEMTQAERLIDDYLLRRRKLKEDAKQRFTFAELPPSFRKATEPAPLFKVAHKRKTDVIKVFYYMMKLGMFVMEDDSPIKEKDFMIAIGTFFADDFSKYLQYNNKAAAMDNYRNVFYELLELAEKKVLGEK